MKIIQLVLGKANPDRPNGVNRVVHSLAYHLNDRGVKVSVWGITATPRDETPPRPYPLRLFRKPSLPFALPPDFKKALASLSPDTIIHMHGVLIPVFRSIARAAGKFGLPVVISPHSALHPKALARRALLKKTYIRCFEKKHLEAAAMVHALTHSEAVDIRKVAPAARISIVPNGIEASSPAETTPASSPVFGYVGRLECFQKGLDILLDGFAKYRRLNGTGKIVIVGSGPDLAWIKARCRELDIESSVSIRGAVFGKELSLIRSSFSASIHTSRWEGIAMSMLESLADGVPIVAGDGTNISETVAEKGAGWRIPDDDPDALAETLCLVESAVSNGSIEKHRLAARNLALGEYSWEHVTQKLLNEVYEKIGSSQPN